MFLRSGIINLTHTILKNIIIPCLFRQDIYLSIGYFFFSNQNVKHDGLILTMIIFPNNFRFFLLY